MGRVSQIARMRGLLTMQDMADLVGVKYQNFLYAVQQTALIPPPTIRDGAGRAYYCEADVDKIKKIISGK
jgi:hypothetical protein